MMMMMKVLDETKRTSMKTMKLTGTANIVHPPDVVLAWTILVFVVHVLMDVTLFFSILLFASLFRSLSWKQNLRRRRLSLFLFLFLC